MKKYKFKYCADGRVYEKVIKTSIPKQAVENSFFQRYMLHDVLGIGVFKDIEKYRNILDKVMGNGYVKNGKLYRFIGFYEYS